MPKLTLYYVDNLEADRHQRFAAFQGHALPPSLYARVASYTLYDDVEDPVALEDAFRRGGTPAPRRTCGSLHAPWLRRHLAILRW